MIASSATKVRLMSGWSAACLSLLILTPLSVAETVLTVAADGGADYKSVADALHDVPDDGTARTLIHVKPGTYFGQIRIDRHKSNVTLFGDDPANTKLIWNEWSQQRPELHTFNPGLQVEGDGFIAENLTFENSYGDHGQAVALRLDGDRELIRNCRIVGWQDTLMINGGRDYFDHCYIAGRVDFIFGSATSWFEACEIHSRNGGHITAASTPKENPFGYVFNRCKLTGDSLPWKRSPAGAATPTTAPSPTADLGRPWRPYASVTWLNCDMGPHIKPTGWNSWLKPGETISPNEATARYAEYRSTGPGAAPTQRLPWTHQLSDEAALDIIPDVVIGGGDHWKPQAVQSTTQPMKP